jgi:hypothetical protein
MHIDDKLHINIQNLSTTTPIDSHFTFTTESFEDVNDMTRILSYAIPLSCLAIVMVLLIAVGILRRQSVLEKWSSLKRMKNTNPRFYERTGLRRDSEYEEESYDNMVNVTTINENAPIEKEPEYHIATIT